MLNHPTLDQLKSLKLDGMAEAFAELETQDGTTALSHPEWLALLIDRETSSRATKRFESRMRTARLRHVGDAPEDVDYRARRNLDKALFQQLLTGKWIRDKRNLMIHCLTGDACIAEKSRPLWRRKDVACLRAGPIRMQRRKNSPLQTPAQTVR